MQRMNMLCILLLLRILLLQRVQYICRVRVRTLLLLGGGGCG